MELLDGEAFVADSGDEVAGLELFFYGFDGFFLLGAADGGADERGAAFGGGVGAEEGRGGWD